MSTAEKDIQKKIDWIKSELDRVDDPNLVEIFVRLLKYRKSAIEMGLEDQKQPKSDD